MLSDELERLSSNEVQNFVLGHEKDDVKKLLLKAKEIFGVPSGVIADQISVRKKIALKVPSYYKARGIIYPSSFNVEQCSSEATAKFKVQLVLKELGVGYVGSVADLTGGFGVDCYFFSQVAKNLDFIEPDKSLSKIVRHNFEILGVRNLDFHNTTAESFLKASSRKFDIVFIDPSRRDVRSKKVFRLSDSQPDIINLLPQLYRVTKYVLLKASPLLDLQQGIRELIHVRKIFVIAVANECKELLFLLQENFSGESTVETYNLDKQGEVSQYFYFTSGEEKSAYADFGEPQTYLYEPNASILKSGAFKLVGQKFGLSKLHPNTHLYTSSVLKRDFPGRVFRVDHLTFDSNLIPGKKANVITRNYPLKAEELKKKLNLADGGEKYVIGFSGIKKKYVVLATRLE